MDLGKIGRYIASKRKALGMTQVQLAEKLGMSDKSVSKWERGICLPDVSIYMELCDILGITLNEFLAGEDLSEEAVVRKSEENILDVSRDGAFRRKKLKCIIAGLLVAVLFTCSVLIGMVYRMKHPDTNYVEPVDKESARMATANMLSGDDGAYLYQYSMDGSYSKVTLYLTVYENGIPVEKSELATLPSTEGQDEGMIAFVPDFSQFQIKTILAGDGIESSGQFAILDGVTGREYYIRSAGEMAERAAIIRGKEQGVVCFLYDNDKLEVFSTDLLEEMLKVGETLSGNEFLYYVTVCFE